MKTRGILYSLLIAGIIVISGCGRENKELKKDAKAIADVMCKSMEAMKNLKNVAPTDSLMVKKFQLEYKNIQAEMAILYQEFKIKYNDKAKTKEFNENFSKYLSEYMLDCKCLSKEERESFEKGIK